MNKQIKMYLIFATFVLFVVLGCDDRFSVDKNPTLEATSTAPTPIPAPAPEETISRAWTDAFD